MWTQIYLNFTMSLFIKWLAFPVNDFIPKFAESFAETILVLYFFVSCFGYLFPTTLNLTGDTRVSMFRMVCTVDKKSFQARWNLRLNYDISGPYNRVLCSTT